MKKSLFFFIFCFSLMYLKSQIYSPYYFHDTLKDEGLTSDIHAKYAKKIYFAEWGSPKNSGWIKDKNENTLQFNRKHEIKAHLYLDRSPRFYYNKYYNDKNLNPKDWDYYTSKGNYPGVKTAASYLGYFLFVMTVNNDTACVWKTSINKFHFSKTTHFEFRFWSANNDNKNMGDDDYFFPLFSYIKSKKQAGEFNVRIDVYPGKLICKNINDRGPDLLATGTIKFIVSQEDIDHLKEVSDKSNKLKFKDYDFDNKPLWGVKQ